MAKKKVEVVVEPVEEVVEHVVTRPYDGTVNDLVADALPSLNDE